jgi:putative phage-type endonuclease
MFYINDHLEQGSRSWLDWRKGVIGASEAGTIMGENPWSSADYLLKEKLGLVAEFTGNEATREGQRLEPEARGKLERHHKTRLRATIVQDGELPFIAASLDGITHDNSMVYEIKCGQKGYERTRQTKKPPDYNRAQLQHILMVTEMDFMHFAAYRPGMPLIILKIGRKESYIRRLRDAEEAFATKLMKRGHTIQRTFVGYAAA